MEIRPDRSLDLRGKKCPFTVLEMGMAMRELAGGQVLEIVVENEGMIDEIRSWCRGTGVEFMGSQASGTTKVYMRKM